MWTGIPVDAILGDLQYVSYKFMNPVQITDIRSERKQIGLLAEKQKSKLLPYKPGARHEEKKGRIKKLQLVN
jgi:hypothetical protein